MAEAVNPRTKPIAIGVDVGSTTVKAVVVDPETKEIMWSDYLRHQTKQAEFVMSFLERIAEAFPNVKHSDTRVFITGSGGGCQNCKIDQFTPSSRKGRMISMPSAMSNARQSGKVC